MNKELKIKYLREILKSAGDERELSDDEGMEFILAAEDIQEDDYDDIILMMLEMREHAKNNKRRIYNEDKPLEFRIGWMCAQTGRRF